MEATQQVGKKERGKEARGVRYHYAEEIQNIATSEDGVDF